MCVACMRDVCAGPAAGVYSARAGTVTFVLKCMSAGAYECVKKVKIVCDLLSNTISLYDAVGWCHHHTGEFKLKRGLPPAAKEDVKEILGLHPHIKPRLALLLMPFTFSCAPPPPLSLHTC
jgi:hypothetical protein